MRLIDADKLENDIVENITVKAVSRMLAIIQGQPIVKAIPVEWILNKYRGKWEKAEMGRRDFQFIEVIDELLADWKKENQSLE